MTNKEYNSLFTEQEIPKFMDFVNYIEILNNLFISINEHKKDVENKLKNCNEIPVIFPIMHAIAQQLTNLASDILKQRDVLKYIGHYHYMDEDTSFYNDIQPLPQSE